MRAVIQDRYGAPETALHVLDDVERPTPAAGEVLVHVHASTVTRGEAMGVRFREYRFTRLLVGIRRPRQPVRGMEFAGLVEEVGPGVSDLSVGDEVFGIHDGTCAEYVAVPVSRAIAPKPGALTFEQAAAVPDGSLLALTCLKPAYPLAGKRVLVHGAAGSVGTAAVQLLAHHFDTAEITGVCDTKDVDIVRGLGAHHVIDRFEEDFTENGQVYDVIFDAVGKHSFRRCRRSLAPRGIYVSMDLGYGYHLPFLALVTKVLRKRRAAFGVGRYRREDLLLVRELVEAGKYTPVIDRIYSMDEIVEAFEYVESGRKTGNVVIRITGSTD
ncbi:MAG TPA: NAD(P)-dependent alcohol dehydrogenase [Actinomycetota bacterium]|nr:NAD(P)-dependent alcohol dehydrogenase [Actinomycetota bacterium]